VHEITDRRGGGRSTVDNLLVSMVLRDKLLPQIDSFWFNSLIK
jgi:hypothetical protein